MMPVKGRKFISEFLLPKLHSKRFGTRLMWLNVKYSIFQVQWCHKSAADWTSYDAEVFMEWDKIKGRCPSDDKECFTKSKQRFRAIIYKLIKGNHITELGSDKCTKIYCLGKKDIIPSEVIERALQLKESRDKSSERIYRCDPETIMSFIGEYSNDSFLENQNTIIAEDHKYANRPREVLTESDAVPENRVRQFISSDTQDMYINIFKSLPDKHGTVLKLEDSSMEDFDGSNINCTILGDDTWGGISENNLYELSFDENIILYESFLSNHDKMEKFCTKSGNQSLPFSEVWNNSLP